MSKSLEEMTMKELRQYMYEHQNNDQEWEKAYDLFQSKADWTKVPADTPLEEQKQIIKKLIAKRSK